MNKKQAALFFKKMGGREGLAERALNIANEIVETGSYKRAIAGAGQLQVIAEIAKKADLYWGEVTDRGYVKEFFYAEHPKSIPPILGGDGHLCQAHWDAEREAELIK